MNTGGLDGSSIKSGAAQTASSLQQQWENPSGVVSILLIVAGDVVGQALAQLSGPSVVPVVFSFGWVSYAVQAFINAIGIHQLLNPSDSRSSDLVVDVSSGRTCTNQSWILKRLLRDHDTWGLKEAKDNDAHGISSSASEAGDRDAEHTLGRQGEDLLDGNDLSRPLKITIYSASTTQEPGVCEFDRLWYSGIFVAIVQLGIAAVPCGLSGEWAVLMVTAAGNALAFATGALPQFGEEKWGTVGKNSRKTVALVKGNVEESSEVVVIRSLGLGFDIESLAKERSSVKTKLVRRYTFEKHQVTAWPWTRSATASLAACWIVLLIMVSSLRSNSWYLLGIGCLGLVQNSFVAGSPRDPATQGMKLNFESSFKKQGAGKALLIVEKQYRGLGKALFKSLFPALARTARETWWQECLDIPGADEKLS